MKTPLFRKNNFEILIHFLKKKSQHLFLFDHVSINTLQLFTAFGSIRHTAKIKRTCIVFSAKIRIISDSFL